MSRGGWKHSDETRAKMSAARRGKPRSPETREKIAEALRGRKRRTDAPAAPPPLVPASRADDERRLIAAAVAAGRVTVIAPGTLRCEHLIRSGVRCADKPEPGSTRCTNHNSVKARTHHARTMNVVAAIARRQAT